MPRKPKDLRSDLSLWGIGVAYCAGILVTLVVIVMVSSGTRALKFKGRYNQSSASGLDSTSASVLQKSGSAMQDNNNLLQNGSFELPVIRSHSQLAFEDSTGFAWRPNWVSSNSTKLGRSSAQPGVELLAGYRNWEAHEGNQFVRLDNADLSARAVRGKSLVRLSQQIPTDERQQYKLAFWSAPQPGTGVKENIVTVLWNGSVLDTISTDGTKDKQPQWKQYAYAVVGGASGVGTVEFVAGGPENGQGPLLDDVVVSAASVE